MAGGNEFVDQFIDDYFSECDEHLATVRRVLLSLEETANEPPKPTDVQELSRALHTLKGLSGMVGLPAAEEVAHAMEDLTRAAPRDRGLPGELLELLFTGVALLEACVSSRRHNITPPSPGPYVDQTRDVLRALSASPKLTSAPPNSVDQLTTGLTQISGNVRAFEFAPSAELVSRGVGVEVIRQRLASLGEIAATVPHVRPDGTVTFEFRVAVREGQEPAEAWRNDGLSWDALDTPTAKSATGVAVHDGTTVATPGAVLPTTSNVVRVDLTRLDDLMRMVGELVVARARLGELVAQASGAPTTAVWDDLNETSDLIERQLRAVREGVMRVRLVAVNEVFERMRFAMRDIARETHKLIHLQFGGQETEIDKLVVDRMLEPLLHLVRNAASHGIERRADRLAAGKGSEGTIWLRARAAGDRIVIEVEDDGGGIDPQRIAARATALGLLASADALAPDALLEILCSPGFSTRETADMASGRGVGMAVVRSSVRRLGGELFVESIVGHGTRFTIELPLTLMIADALILEVGEQVMAIPQVVLREIVPLDPASVTRLESNEVFSYRGKVVPLVNVGRLFKLASRPGVSRHVLIVGTEAHPTGLVVDRLIGLREIVIHPVTDALIAVPGIAGATELANGCVSLILDAAALVRGARESAFGAPSHSLPAPVHESVRDARPPFATIEHRSERLWS